MAERFVTLHGNKLTLVGDALKVGDIAPDFRLLDKELKPVTLQDFTGRAKLISVVPSLDTGVCDQQTRRFNEEANSLGNLAVITVSVDLPFAQARWCGAAGLDNAITLSDHYDVSFGRAYGVLIKELRILSRAVFVVDRHNRIVYSEYLPEVGNHPNYEQALLVAKGLA